MKNIYLFLFLLTLPFSGIFGQTTMYAGLDTAICLGGTASLHAQVTGGGFGTDSYTFEIIPYSPEAYSGGTAIDPTLKQCSGGSAHDDCYGGPYPIGFSFCFFNHIYTQFYVGTNGWIGFTDPAGHGWTTFTSATIPNTQENVPKNCIFCPWEDWEPGRGSSPNNMFYYLTGSAPNQKLVVYWKDCPMYGCTSLLGTFQIVINETSSIVENHITYKTICSNHTATQGVHNADGTVAFWATGRNSTIWTAQNESTRFVPSGIKWYTGGYPGGTIVGYGPDLVISPGVTTTYTAVVETCGSSAATDDVIVNVVDAGFNYTVNTFCSNDVDPVANVLQPGGTFSATPAGLVFLNTTTGEIDLSASTPGAYMVTYAITTPCVISQTHPLTIVSPPPPPAASPDTVSRCGPGDVYLNVIQAPGTQIYWYDAPAGGTKFPGSGTPYLVSIATGATFYAEAITTLNNCISLSRTPIVAVINPIPGIANTTLNFQLCSGDSTNIGLLSTVNPATFSWTASSGFPGISGFTNGSGNLIRQKLINSGITPGTVKYSVTPHSLFCDGLPLEFNVVVNPVPDLTTNPISQNVCSGKQLNIALGSVIPVATFSWTATGSSGNVSGFSDGIGNSIVQNLVNTGYAIETVTYTITAAAYGCSGIPVIYPVTVYPKPDLSNPVKNFTICDSTIINVPLVSNVTGTTFTWRAFASSVELTGYSSQLTGATLISQLIDNKGFTTETVTYRILPLANGCNGDSTDIVVTVYPNPDLSNPIRTASICDNTFANMALTTNVAGTTFTWRAFASSATLTGYSNQLTGTTLINQQIDNTGFTTQTVTYRLLPFANGCPGDSTDIVFTVFPTADLSNTDRTDSICDSTVTNILLSSHVTGTLFTWRAFASSPLVTGHSNSVAPGISILQRLKNNTFVAQTVTYRLLPKANGCPGDSVDFVVTLFPRPDLTTAPLVKEICNNNNTDIILTSNVATTLFTWTCTPSSVNITGYSNSAAPLGVISQNLINTGDTPETVTYHITPHANGCSGWVYNFVVTVVPSPYLTNTPLRKTQCNNLNTSLTLTSNVAGTLFNWTASSSSVNLTGYSNSVAPATTILQTLVNSGYNVDSVTYHVTPESSGCPGSTTDYYVVVYPVPDLSNPVRTFTICDSTIFNVPLASNVAGTTFTWRAFASSPTLTGYSSQITGSTLINQRIDNTGFTTQTVTYRILPRANNCTGDSTDIVVTVYPKPDLSNPIRTASICDNTFANMALTTNVTGTTFTWRAFANSATLAGYSNQLTGTTLINQQIDNTGFTTQTVTYRLLPFANGCPGDSTDIVFTVYPTADLSNTDRTDSICDSTVTNILLSSHVTGTLFTWRAFASSPLVTGHSNSIAPGLSILQRLMNNSYVAQTVTYRLLPKANGCPGDSVDFVVTLFPRPDLTTLPLVKEICNNNNTAITLTSNVATTLFTWTCTPSSGNITGYSNSAAPLGVISQNLINTGDTPETVTYHITPHANGCSGWVYNFVVTVVPSPYMTNSPLRKTQCNNLNTNLTLTSNVAGTLFNWTASSSSVNLTGYSNSVVAGTLISQTLVNSGYNVDSVTYHVTPESSGCPGSTTDYYVVVYPNPDVYFSPNGQTLCEGVISNIALLSHALGTSYSWTASPSSPNLSGYSDNSGSVIAQTISNAGNTTESVTYFVTPTANGCPPGASQNVVLTIRPRPAINNAVTTSQVCNNSPTSIVPLADVPLSTFAWRAFASSASVSGYTSGAGPSIIQTLVNSGFNIETVTYRVAATATGCAGDSTDFVVTVFPVADVYFIPATQNICPMQSCNIMINSHVAGSTFAWSASGSSPLVSGYFPDAGSQINQVLNNTGNNNETVTYVVSPAANGCPGVSQPVVVTVNPSPVVSFTLCIDPATTTDAQPIRLKGGVPVNGIYSGRGVAASVLNPALAGVGADTIYYSFSNSYGCSANSFVVVSVIAPLPFACGGALTDPRDNGQYPTLQIAGQCWMDANLDYGQQINSGLTQRDNCIVEKFCYSDNPGSCATSGGLYQWNELMKYDNTAAGQGYCPPGWHVPTENDWNTLFGNFLGNGFAGSPLKSSGYSGFNALLNGVFFKNVSMSFNGFATIFWSSSSHGPDKAWAHGMNNDNPSVSYYPSSRTNAFPVRCIKD